MLYLKLTDAAGEDLGRMEIRRLDSEPDPYCDYEINAIDLKLSPGGRKRYNARLVLRLRRSSGAWAIAREALLGTLHYFRSRMP